MPCLRPPAAPALASAFLLAGCASLPPAARGPLDPAGPAVLAVGAASVSLSGGEADYDPLLASIGGAEIVVLGESTHGTREFYRERARITRRLIEEKGFAAVVLEADWTPTARVNRFVRGLGADVSPEAALADFDRFPTWMWRNEEAAELAGWLRAYNARVSAGAGVGVYGMDLYDMFAAADAVVSHLDSTHAAAAERARRGYACFEPYRPDAERYGAASVARSCADDVADVLTLLRRERGTRGTESEGTEAWLSALGSAEAVAAAEEFYRTMFVAGASVWSVRDRHMAKRVGTIREELRRSGRSPRIVIWTHNTHAGDARATEAADSGDVNLGQLLRERHGRDAYLVGFFTYAGTVLAAPAWGEAGRTVELPPALAGSVDDLFRAAGSPRSLLLLRSHVPAELSRPRRQRAVGVVYRPAADTAGYYFTARLAQQFDAAVFLHTTGAVAPLPLD